MKFYTVKQLSRLAGVSVRTLHHYDRIGLLKPSYVADNGYRHYDDSALLRLQQILLYRELGVELRRIKAILDNPDFDLGAALREHRDALLNRIERYIGLIAAVDSTIEHVSGGGEMSKRKMFKPFTEAEEKHYTRLARLQYDPEIVDESVKRYNSYTTAQKQAIGEEGNQVYSDLVDALQAGTGADSQKVQAILVRWHQHLRYFYEPTLEILRGLGELYNTHEGFIANFKKLHPDLPAFLQAGIGVYVDALETAAIQRLLADDEAQAGGAE